MNWLEKLLQQTGQQRDALLSAAQGQPAFAPGPQEDSAAARVADVAPAAAPADPVQALLAAYQQYTRRRPKGDPLLRRNRGRILPVSEGSELARAASASVTQRGPRAGRAKHTVALGDGRLANVYYDEDGRRQVMVFRPGGGSSK